MSDHLRWWKLLPSPVLSPFYQMLWKTRDMICTDASRLLTVCKSRISPLGADVFFPPSGQMWASSPSLKPGSLHTARLASVWTRFFKMAHEKSPRYTVPRSGLFLVLGVFRRRQRSASPSSSHTAQPGLLVPVTEGPSAQCACPSITTSM